MDVLLRYEVDDVPIVVALADDQILCQVSAPTLTVQITPAAMSASLVEEV